MAIYRYNEGDHPGGFIGLRVTVMIDGKRHQKYFRFLRKPGEYISLRDEQRLRVEANRLNKQWLKQKKDFGENRKNNRDYFTHKHRSVYNTGVLGISARFLVDLKFRRNKWIYYYSPGFRVHFHIEKKRFVKVFRCHNNYRQAWRDAIDFYCDCHGIKNKKPFFNRMPDKTIFKKIRRYQNKQGHDIPILKLP